MKVFKTMLHPQKSKKKRKKTQKKKTERMLMTITLQLIASLKIYLSTRKNRILRLKMGLMMIKRIKIKSLYKKKIKRKMIK